MLDYTLTHAPITPQELVKHFLGFEEERPTGSVTLAGRWVAHAPHRL